MRSGCHRSQEGVCRLCCIWTKPRAPWAAASGAASRLAPRVAHPSGRLVGQAGGWQMFFPGEQAGRCKASPDPSALPRQLMGALVWSRHCSLGNLGGSSLNKILCWGEPETWLQSPAPHLLMERPKPLALFPHLHMGCDLGAVGGRGENVCNVAAQVLSWGQRRVTGRTRVGGVPERPRGGGAGGGPGQRGQGPGPSKAATPLSSPGSRVVGSPRRLSTPPTPSASGSVPAARLALERSGTEPRRGRACLGGPSAP